MSGNKKLTTLSILLGAMLIGLRFTPADAQSSGPPDSPHISTIAGDGGEGIVDGRASNARFVYPAGLAYSRDGQTLYIADRGAQRIRILTSQGMVRTIAGSGNYITGIGVPGGYIDGPALSAKFSNPVGLAVGPDGAVYIADTKNHAIRVLRHNIVSTLAGSPLRSGGDDGPLATATFGDPRSLAFDHLGNLYVADFNNGVRKITPDGIVSTIVKNGAITSISVINDAYQGGKESLLTTSIRNINEYDLATMQPTPQMGLDPSFISPSGMDGFPFLGPALSIAPIDGYSYVYADPFFRTVRWMSVRPLVSERVLGQEPLADSGLPSGPMQDGDGQTASFTEPVAVAHAPDGSITVADAGARRIRRVGRFDEAYPAGYEQMGELKGSANAHQYRVLLFGDSYVFGGAFPWKYSVGGLLQSRLQQSPTAKDVRIYTIRRAGTWPPDMLNLIETYGMSDAADAVVFDVGWMMYSTGGDSTEAGFADKLPAFVEHLKTVKKEFASKGIPLYVLFYLRAWDYPSEMTYRFVPKEDGSSDVGLKDPAVIWREYQLMRHTLADAGISVVDPTDAMRSYRVMPNAEPLFDLWDAHMTVEGCRLVSSTIAKQLLIDHPWSKQQVNSSH